MLARLLISFLLLKLIPSLKEHHSRFLILPLLGTPGGSLKDGSSCPDWCILIIPMKCRQFKLGKGDPHLDVFGSEKESLIDIPCLVIVMIGDMEIYESLPDNL